MNVSGSSGRLLPSLLCDERLCGGDPVPNTKVGRSKKATRENLGKILNENVELSKLKFYLEFSFIQKGQFNPPPRWQDKGRKARRRGSKLAKNTVTDIVPMVKKCEAICRSFSNLSLTLQVPSPLCGDANFEQRGKRRLLVLADLRES